jgi:hypothetical protein
MILQSLIVGAIVFSALILTIIRLIRFFMTPVSKCHGCSGCKLEELKTDIKKLRLTRDA